MSFPGYPKYKPSGVEWLGDVPEHWAVIPCRAIVHERTAKNDGAECIFENLAFQTFAQFFGNGILDHRCAINWDILKAIGVGVPPADEQKTILGFLDRETAKIDGLVGEQRRLIELLKEKRQAVISHAITKGLNLTPL